MHFVYINSIIICSTIYLWPIIIIYTIRRVFFWSSLGKWQYWFLFLLLKCDINWGQFSLVALFKSKMSYVKMTICARFKQMQQLGCTQFKAEVCNLLRHWWGRVLTSALNCVHPNCCICFNRAHMDNKKNKKNGHGFNLWFWVCYQKTLR